MAQVPMCIQAGWTWIPIYIAQMKRNETKHWVNCTVCIKTECGKNVEKNNVQSDKSNYSHKWCDCVPMK